MLGLVRFPYSTTRRPPHLCHNNSNSYNGSSRNTTHQHPFTEDARARVHRRRTYARAPSAPRPARPCLTGKGRCPSRPRRATTAGQTRRVAQTRQHTACPSSAGRLEGNARDRSPFTQRSSLRWRRPTPPRPRMKSWKTQISVMSDQ